MVKLNKIYTRTGDNGTTGLVDGSRVLKSTALIGAIGDVDEANSAIGVAIAEIRGAALGATSSAFWLITLLERIQNDLFDLGADLATPEATPGEALRILPGQVARLEQEIDSFNEQLTPLTSFILPGGSRAAAAMHVGRATVRRAERSAIRAAGEVPISADCVAYLNRLSDYLFVAARILNQNDAGDVLWRPGATR
ncbi:cob(I)yrinic acid a,c-diamide adenosyltransferase [Sphingomonas sp. AR_OL41]|uniref:cob(I)yrinic acid a,c-diamide adenosyltransferase n=1 Tax=Sphingomonas sp. AR_OL41 TaxID=3042729 RepID=UPI0024809555|nr:cob(I)yrinic acid a,c-diamide adenosyltransferase [Sphingomonas sp. AR_OL41]MDH7972165.1 cob(I)yrinic acid a,c-diamide adenosyltransferase [Sphingomonas sp. AR_OL41]